MAAHPLAALVLSRAQPRADGLGFSDAALVEIVGSYAESLGTDDAGPATEALLTVAMFLEVEKKSPRAANMLVTLVFAAEPALRARGDAQAKSAADRVAQTRARFDDFKGDERVTRVLDSGARPAGTTAASPLARFQMKIPPKT